MTVKVFWQPQSFNLDQIGQKRLVDISDGDTPNIRMNAGFSYGLQTCARRWQTSTWSPPGRSPGFDTQRIVFGWLAGKIRLKAVADERLL